MSIHPEDITLYFLLPAQVQGYAQNSKDGEKILLTCIARGQGAIDVEIKRNGETVTEEKGLMRSGAETNKDGPLEIRAHVEISKDDKSKYSYEVIYKNQNIKHDFGKKFYTVFVICQSFLCFQTCCCLELWQLMYSGPEFHSEILVFCIIYLLYNNHRISSNIVLLRPCIALE